MHEYNSSSIMFLGKGATSRASGLCAAGCSMRATGSETNRQTPEHLSYSSDRQHVVTVRVYWVVHHIEKSPLRLYDCGASVCCCVRCHVVISTPSAHTMRHAGVCLHRIIYTAPSTPIPHKGNTREHSMTHLPDRVLPQSRCACFPTETARPCV